MGDRGRGIDLPTAVLRVLRTLELGSGVINLRLTCLRNQDASDV